MDHFQHHMHNVKADRAKSGSAYQAFHKRRRVTAWDCISTAGLVVLCLILLFALPWEGGW